MPTIESNAGGQLVKAGDVIGDYFYIADGLGNPVVGAWVDEQEARDSFEWITEGGGEAGSLEGDIEIDEAGHRLVLCLYCTCQVRLGGAVPGADDEQGWKEASKGHADDCEWVQTRAHRRNTEGFRTAVRERRWGTVAAMVEEHSWAGSRRHDDGSDALTEWLTEGTWDGTETPWGVAAEWDDIEAEKESV